MAVLSLPKRYRVSAAIFSLAVFVALIGFYFFAPRADEPTPLAPQYPLGAAVWGFALNDPTTLGEEPFDGVAMYTYPADGGVSGATVATYNKNTGVKLHENITDSDFVFFFDERPTTPDNPMVLCAFKGGAVANLNLLTSDETRVCKDPVDIPEYEDAFFALKPIDRHGLAELVVRVTDSTNGQHINNPGVNVVVNQCTVETFRNDNLTYSAEDGFFYGFLAANQDCSIEASFFGASNMIVKPIVAPKNAPPYDIPLAPNYSGGLAADPRPAVRKKHTVLTPKSTPSAAQIEETRGAIIGSVQDEQGRPVALSLRLDRDFDIVNRTTGTRAVRLSKDVPVRGDFTIGNLALVEKRDNPYIISLTTNGYEIVAMTLHGRDITSNGNRVVLSKTSKPLPYQPNGLLIIVRRVNSASLTGKTVIIDNSSIRNVGTFTVATPQKAYANVATFDYKSSPHPQIGQTYTVSFAPSDANAEIISYKDQSNNRLDLDSEGNPNPAGGARVPLTSENKAVTVTVELRKKIVASLEGETQKVSDAVADDKGRFVISSPNQITENSNRFTYRQGNDPLVGKTYTVVFQPSNSTVVVEGYYDKVTGEPLETSGQTTVSAQVAITPENKDRKVLVKLRPKSETFVSVKVPTISSIPQLVWDGKDSKGGFGRSGLGAIHPITGLVGGVLARNESWYVFTTFHSTNFSAEISSDLGKIALGTTDVPDKKVDTIVDSQAATTGANLNIKGTNKFSDHLCMVKQLRAGLARKQKTQYWVVTLKNQDRMQIGAPGRKHIQFETNLDKQISLTRGTKNPITITLDELKVATEITALGDLQERDFDQKIKVSDEDGHKLTITKIQECLAKSEAENHKAPHTQDHS